MFRLTRPDSREISRQLVTQAAGPTPDLGYSSDREAEAAGYRIDHEEHRLGTGFATFQAARDSLARWGHYDQSWIQVYPSPPECRAGATLAVAARTYGLWSVNFCRMVAVTDEESPLRRFELMYRTLPEHVERGDATYAVEQRADDSVWLVVHTISRIHHWLPRLLPGLGRRAQRRARLGAADALRRTLSAESPRGAS